MSDSLCCISVCKGANFKKIIMNCCHWKYFFFQFRWCVSLGLKRAAAHRDGVDVAGVSAEGLFAGAFPQVPQLGQRVTGSRDESIHVWRQSQGHAVSNVVGEDNLLLAGLQVPETAGHNRGKKRDRPGLILAVRGGKKSNHPSSERAHQVVSPEAVTISLSLKKRQQDR